MNNKQIKLLKFLGITAVVGGIVPVVALTTSCGKAQDISSLIKVRDLGVMANKTEATIKQNVELANPRAGDIKWSQLQITAITSTSAFISATEDSATYKGFVKVVFTLAGATDLSSLITIDYLGEIENNSEQAIQTKIVELNMPSLTWSQIEITNITATSAHIEAKADSDLYYGYVNVAFTLPVIDISSIITQVELGEVQSDTAQAIQTKIIALNSNAGSLTWDQIEFSEITTTSAHIEAKADSTLYTGYVDVVFTTATVSYNAQGTNWPGYISGSLSCTLDNTNHTCAVTGGTTYNASNLVIPDVIVSNGISYNVVAINDDCFRANDHLTGTLTLGNNLTTIGVASFYRCRYITGQLTFPNSITNILSDAFEECVGISGQITMPTNPNFTTIDNATFSYMTSLTSVVIPANITSIASAAFASGSNIAEFRCNFASAPSVGEQCFSDVKNIGTILNLNPSYSSDDLCALFKTAGLPDDWTVEE